MHARLVFDVNSDSDGEEVTHEDQESDPNPPATSRDLQPTPKPKWSSRVSLAHQLNQLNQPEARCDELVEPPTA